MPDHELESTSATRMSREGSVKPETRKPASEKKLQANRENARKSTGPKTPAGKAVVGRNALKHGVRSGRLSVLSDESVERFNAMLLNIMKTGAPTSIEERALLEEIAGLWWKLRRLVQQEGIYLSYVSDPDLDPSTRLRLFRRYEGSLSRQLGVRIRRFIQLRGEPPKLTCGDNCP
jgi:hypothetical protein